MIARNYNSKIDIYALTETSDGFGGVISSPSLVKSIWAKVETKNAGRRFTEYGLNTFVNPVIFRVRATNNIDINENSYVLYKGKKYLIKGIENVNLDDLELNLYCDEQKLT